MIKWEMGIGLMISPEESRRVASKTDQLRLTLSTSGAALSIVSDGVYSCTLGGISDAQPAPRTTAKNTEEYLTVVLDAIAVACLLELRNTVMPFPKRSGLPPLHRPPGYRRRWPPGPAAGRLEPGMAGWGDGAGGDAGGRGRQ